MLSDGELVILMNDSLKQMREGVYSPSLMVKRSSGIFWGEVGFLEAYNKRIQALEALGETGYDIVRRYNVAINSNEMPVKRLEYRLANASKLF